MENTDTIEIRSLKLRTFIGVPDEERAAEQTLLLTVRMSLSQGFHGLADDISRTIDYHAVTLELQQLAAARPRNLIETLALETADWLLSKHPLRRVEVTLEKHILPDTECVAVHLVRKR
jgi:7,8-dihydroneopterin aldolase/epimerase/oxygenase